MKQQHPITPPRDKIHNWLQLEKTGWSIEQIITAVAQWGADQELEACCEWTADSFGDFFSQNLHLFRRPKPPSLKEQALEMLDRIPTHDREGRSVDVDVSILRRAVEMAPGE